MDLETCLVEAQREWLAEYKTGPLRTRWTRLPLQVGDAAPDAELPDQDGAPTRLSQAWAGGPALILFWRQFGCGCGRERASRLARELPEYEAVGATLLIVGHGHPLQAAEYRRQLAVDVPILVDAERSAYEAYGLLEGFPSQFYYDSSEALLARDPDAGRTLAEERRALGRPMVNSPWQLPGEFVIDARGIVRLAYRYQYCEDFPDPRVLVAAIGEARA